MKRYIQLWIWGFMLSISLYTNNACAGDPQTLMNHWTVFKDTYTDYNVIHPLDPFWVEKNGGQTKNYIKSDDSNNYNLSSCLVNTSPDAETIIFHRTRLANYSYQYYARIPSGGGWSESVFRFNYTPGDIKVGYSLLIYENGDVVLRRFYDTNFVTIAQANIANFQPQDIFYVKIDISGPSFIISVNNTQIIDYWDTQPYLQTGGIGFRAAAGSKAYYFYSRLDVQAQGEWKILYEALKSDNSLDMDYIDPDASNSIGTPLITESEINQVFPNCFVRYAVPDPFGNKIIYQIGKYNDAYSYAFAVSDANGDNFRLLYNFSAEPDFQQELNSVGVDGLAYILVGGGIGTLTIPSSGTGTYTEIEGNNYSYKAGPIISPDGSFLNHIHTRMQNSTTPIAVPIANSSNTVTVYDEWLMDAGAQNDYRYAQSPLNEYNGVKENYSQSISGFEVSPQQWEWGMGNTWYEQYGPYDGSPNGCSPTPIWSWNIRNGTYSEYTMMKDNSSPTPNNYPGYWAWPIPDPRWDGNSPNQLIASYNSPGWDFSGIYLISKQAYPNLGNSKIGQVINQITGTIPNSDQVGAFWGVWWNKPSD